MDTAKPDADVKGTKVLIVDDSATIRGLLNRLLDAEGYRVVGQLVSGNGLLEAIDRTDPNIVCLDYNLPGTNGLELLRQIHSLHPATAVVMITGNTDLHLEDLAAEAGAAGFITKPFSTEKILLDLSQVVRANRMLAAADRTRANTNIRTSRAKVVIADDSATMRALLSAILATAHIEVIGEAPNGKQAVELVGKHLPDIVCLDWDMPVMNGLEALRIIRTKHPNSKVLMITARASREAIVQANQSGAKGYILKPFHPDKVIGAIAKLMG